jgi:hypothetical protein
MKLVDTDTVLSGFLGIKREYIRWISLIKSVDARKVGGWMFENRWINARFEGNVSAPAPVVCAYDNNGETAYWLLLLHCDGTFEKIAFSEGRGWADALLPHILRIFEEHRGEKQIFETTISGEPLKAARWLCKHLHEDATAHDAVDFALKFAKIVLEKRQWQDTTKLLQHPTELESEKSGTSTPMEQDIDSSVI